ncbi:alpha-tocopherol transfer protein-like isoform X2 [Pseudomyrmex gracilis]|uniref:alpha-tocopherol transfer protein-like isoform X2 n=1 Tax=Pseudomyrmex gracilis TaxID=219809 RepID=UPI000994E66A|nr:alpha-tocopherol transfer protein-like isoform X2 [Pseudomyrmex gracilis]
MPQENEKTGKAESWTKERENDAKNNHEDREILGRKKTDVVLEEDLRILKDDMPEEFTNDQKLLDDEQIRLDLSEPSPDVMEYARRELGETEEVKCQMLQELRDMIYERGECLPHRMDDEFLIRFLRARNFNVKWTHRLIANYYTFKEEHPELHQQLGLSQMRAIGEDDVITVPPYRTACGRRMLIYRIGNWDPRKYPVEELFKATICVLEVGILEPRAQILGGIVIFDLKDITMAHAWQVTPQVASLVLSLMVTSFPMKTHSLHILHQSWIFDAMFAVFKPLIDTNMRNKIFFHGNNYDSFHEHIAPEYLPKMYGGVRNEVPYDKWITSLIKDPKVVEQMDKMGYILTDEILDNFKE